MSLITLLNTYVINDISFIIYDYYYDLYKIKELRKDLLIEYHKKIWELKQYHTYKIIDTEFTYDERIRSVLKSLKSENYIIYVASNCIYSTMKMILLRK